MPKQIYKLGRNPLEKIKVSAPRNFGPLVEENKTKDLGGLALLRQLDIKIDWEEFYQATVGKQLKRFVKIL